MVLELFETMFSVFTWKRVVQSRERRKNTLFEIVVLIFVFKKKFDSFEIKQCGGKKNACGTQEPSNWCLFIDRWIESLRKCNSCDGCTRIITNIFWISPWIVIRRAWEKYIRYSTVVCFYRVAEGAVTRIHLSMPIDVKQSGCVSKIFIQYATNTCTIMQLNVSSNQSRIEHSELKVNTWIKIALESCNAPDTRTNDKK